MSRNLVLAAVGDDSLHRRWLRGRPDFDLFLVYFGEQPGRYAGDGTYHLDARGQKWQLIHRAITGDPERIARYDAVWCPDDDIAISASGINACFAVLRDYNLQLAQPAVAYGRNVSHPLCAEHAGLLLRYTRFVEIQAPMFSRAALRKLTPTFAETGTGWGLDLVWPGLLGYEGVAIIDGYPMRHTRLPRSANDEAAADADRLVAKYGDDPERFTVTGTVAGKPLLQAARLTAYRAARFLVRGRP